MQKKSLNSALPVIFGLFIIGGIYFFRPKPKRKKLSDADKKKFIREIEPYTRIIGKKKGVPPDFILAQLALESNFGQSSLAKKYYNFGGIKARPGAPSVRLLTKECKGGKCKKVYQNFAVFPNLLSGLEAQARIYSNPYFKGYAFQTKDANKYARLIQSGRIKYATALNYPQAIQTTLNEINRLRMA